MLLFQGQLETALTSSEIMPEMLDLGVVVDVCLLCGYFMIYPYTAGSICGDVIQSLLRLLTGVFSTK